MAPALTDLLAAMFPQVLEQIRSLHTETRSSV
jgi:hypothetical protein